MKKIIFSLILATGFAFASSAQQGSVLVFGNLAISSDKDEAENKYTTFSVFPGVGYQFTDNWTVGIQGGYAQDKYEPVLGSEIKSSEYAIGVFGRYTHPLGNIFSIYGQADVLYLGGEDAGVDFSGFRAAITPAVSLNVSNGFALNFGFGGLSFESQKEDGAPEAATSFNLFFGQQFSIGISKNFGGKKK